jgi:hypothetical protein
MKPVRFRHASPLQVRIAGAIGRRATLKPWMFRVRLSGDAPNRKPCPDGAIGRHRRLKSDRDARSNRARGTNESVQPNRPYGAIWQTREIESLVVAGSNPATDTTHARLAESGRGSGLRSRNFGVRLSGRAPPLSPSISSVAEHAPDKREAPGSFPRSTTRLVGIDNCQEIPDSCRYPLHSHDSFTDQKVLEIFEYLI